MIAASLFFTRPAAQSRLEPGFPRDNRRFTTKIRAAKSGCRMPDADDPRIWNPEAGIWHPKSGIYFSFT